MKATNPTTASAWLWIAATFFLGLAAGLMNLALVAVGGLFVGLRLRHAGTRAGALGASITAPRGGRTREARVTTEQVWRALATTSFAVISHVTPDGQPRSSGVVYATAGRRLYLVVAPDGWKARHIALNKHVAVTVPVRRGGILSLLFPIPPATISFHATAVVHSMDYPTNGATALKQLEALIPPERRGAGTFIEIIPEGRFVTYGIGVSLMQMRDPAAARANVPVGAGNVMVYVPSRTAVLTTVNAARTNPLTET